MTFDSKAFSYHLLGLRERYNLSQRELADLLPAGERSVLRWEREKRVPSPLAIERVLRLTQRLAEMDAWRQDVDEFAEEEYAAGFDEHDTEEQ